jgi:hypothetical protein
LINQQLRLKGELFKLGETERAEEISLELEGR